jgi:hypothetical protein
VPGGPTYRDLLAYHADDVRAANAAATGATIEPYRRLVGAIPSEGSTGAAFVGDRFFMASQEGDTFRVRSFDLDGPQPAQSRLEIERTVVGESEGLVATGLRGGSLHWLIQPYNTHNQPTYGFTNATLLSFAPAAARHPRRRR